MKPQKANSSGVACNGFYIDILKWCTVHLNGHGYIMKYIKKIAAPQCD